LKKVVRLTESDLTRIVRRVIEERSSKDYVMDILNNQGIKTAKEMFGSAENIQNILGKEYLEKNLFKILKSKGIDFAISLVPDAEEFKRILGVQTPMEFLHLFDNLTIKPYRDKKQLFIFYDDNGNALLSVRYYSGKFTEVHVYGHVIWRTLLEVFDIKNYKNEVQEMIGQWLLDVYGIKADRVSASGKLDN
jgi:hypothetical protein